ncbi:AlpA family transcriptional regulator [Synechococcus sp. N26]|uniref:helix-turn-helix transcriptional regulator n=1 Tax=Synechococcus sp. N26 TaxID=2575513 RepID=UPI0021108336|nr:AlpA family phage regulatory protein [Synechococcus sp. N26]
MLSIDLFGNSWVPLTLSGLPRIRRFDPMRDGTFPKQIQLGSRTVVWNEQEVTKWMEDRMASR